MLRHFYLYNVIYLPQLAALILLLVPENKVGFKLLYYRTSWIRDVFLVATPST